ncbi:MAG: SelL-related redox protein [Phycisphaerales bacterium]
MINHAKSTHPRWMSRWLIAAGVYNLVWGAITVLYPAWLFDLTGLAAPTYPFIWQCVGMIVGVYGIGYLAAARDPIRHWPIVLVGFLGKIFGPMGYAMGLIRGDVPPEFGVTLLTNDLIWWVPFSMMLYASFRFHSGSHAVRDDDVLPVDEAVAAARTECGESLAELSNETPLLVVFLRHAGCTFCREALSDLGSQREKIEEAGKRVVLVHMGEPSSLDGLLGKYSLDGVKVVSDPTLGLYRSFELGRGSLGQLFGIQEFVRGIAASLRGNIIGKLAGDGFQMPGVFIMENGRVVSARRHRVASERPDYRGFACEIPTGCEPEPA